MRDSEIAVNRVSGWISKAMDDPAWQKQAHKTFIGDVCLLLAMAKSNLAEHPDDEDEPITREFLQSDEMPFEDQGKVFAWYRYPGVLKVIDIGKGDFAVFYGNADGGFQGVKTRGQIRQLIKLLKGS